MAQFPTATTAARIPHPHAPLGPKLGGMSLPRRFPSRVKAVVYNFFYLRDCPSQSSAVLPIVQNGIHAAAITQSFLLPRVKVSMVR